MKLSVEIQAFAAFSINRFYYQHKVIQKRVSQHANESKRKLMVEGRTFQPAVDVEKGFLTFDEFN
jgi:hypothetical protein